MIEKKNIYMYIIFRRTYSESYKNIKKMFSGRRYFWVISKKEYIFAIVKSILIIILSIWVVPLSGLLIVYGLASGLFNVRLPNEELQRAITFIQEENYVGMTLEECEEVFGDSGEESPVQYIVYPAGCFRWGWSDEYELYIYFDENEQVKEVILKEERDV